MPNKQIHTVWNKDEKRWDNKKPHAQRISSHAKTKEEAMEMTLIHQKTKSISISFKGNRFD